MEAESENMPRACWGLNPDNWIGPGFSYSSSMKQAHDQLVWLCLVQINTKDIFDKTLASLAQASRAWSAKTCSVNAENQHVDCLRVSANTISDTVYIIFALVPFHSLFCLHCFSVCSVMFYWILFRLFMFPFHAISCLSSLFSISCSFLFWNQWFFVFSLLFIVVIFCSFFFP